MFFVMPKIDPKTGDVTDEKSILVGLAVYEYEDEEDELDGYNVSQGAEFEPVHNFVPGDRLLAGTQIGTVKFEGIDYPYSLPYDLTISTVFNPAIRLKEPGDDDFVFVAHFDVQFDQPLVQFGQSDEEPTEEDMTAFLMRQFGCDGFSDLIAERLAENNRRHTAEMAEREREIEALEAETAAINERNAKRDRDIAIEKRLIRYQQELRPHLEAHTEKQSSIANYHKAAYIFPAIALIANFLGYFPYISVLLYVIAGLMIFSLASPHLYEWSVNRKFAAIEARLQQERDKDIAALEKGASQVDS